MQNFNPSSNRFYTSQSKIENENLSYLQPSPVARYQHYCHTYARFFLALEAVFHFDTIDTINASSAIRSIETV